MDRNPIEDITPLADLPPETPRIQRSRARVLVAGGIGLAVVLVLGLIFGRGSGGGHPVVAPTPRPPAPRPPAPRPPAPRPPAPTLDPHAPNGTLADGLTNVTSLVDTEGYLWAAGEYPGSQPALITVQISSKKATETLLVVPANGASQKLASLTSVAGMVYAVRPDGGVQVMLEDGTPAPSFDVAQLGSETEALAGSTTTGLWLLSCCGAAPAAQQLAQQRDPATGAALGNRREISAIPSTLISAGPAGVWVVDGSNGAVRRVDAIDTPAADPVVEAHPDRLAHDLFAVDSVGPVLATAQQLVTVDATTLAVSRRPLPVGERSPTALAVTGTTAYLAFPDRVIAYDLATRNQETSIPVAQVTALAAGPDGVWAAIPGELVRIKSDP